jgi:hypothetical protein
MQSLALRQRGVAANRSTRCERGVLAAAAAGRRFAPLASARWAAHSMASAGAPLLALRRAPLRRQRGASVAAAAVPSSAGRGGAAAAATVAAAARAASAVAATAAARLAAAAEAHFLAVCLLAGVAAGFVLPSAGVEVARLQPGPFVTAALFVMAGLQVRARASRGCRLRNHAPPSCLKLH